MAIYRDLLMNTLMPVFNLLTLISINRVIFRQFEDFAVNFLLDESRICHNFISSLYDLLTRECVIYLAPMMMIPTKFEADMTVPYLVTDCICW